MMFGDIGIAALISSMAALLIGIGFIINSMKKTTIHLSSSSEDLPVKKINKKLIIGISAAGTAVLAIIIVLLILSNSYESKDEVLTSEQFEQLYTDANPLRGYQVDFYARVFSISDSSANKQTFQVYAQDDSNLNTFITYEGTDIQVKEDMIIHIVGEVTGQETRENMFGVALTLPTIKAKKIVEVNAMTAFAPALTTREINLAYDQYGYSIHVQKIEFAESETRVYVEVSNQMTEDISFYKHSTVIIQNEKQYELQYNEYAGTDFENTDLKPGVKASGMLVFPAIIPDKDFRIIFEGSSSNWDITILPTEFIIYGNGQVEAPVSVTEEELQTDEVGEDIQVSEDVIEEEFVFDPNGAVKADDFYEEIDIRSIIGEGYLPAVPSALGDSLDTVLSNNEGLIETTEYNNGIYYQFADYFYVLSPDDYTVRMISFGTNQTVLGTTMDWTTKEEIKAMYGEPDYEGYDDLSGDYTLNYSNGDYIMFFMFTDETDDVVNGADYFHYLR